MERVYRPLSEKMRSTLFTNTVAWETIKGDELPKYFENLLQVTFADIPFPNIWFIRHEADAIQALQEQKKSL